MPVGSDRCGAALGVVAWWRGMACISDEVDSGLVVQAASAHRHANSVAVVPCAGC